MPYQKEYDLVVAGAGIAGISAAVKAASLGIEVLLVEHYPFPGGMSSAGMVSPFMKSRTGNVDLVKGMYLQLEMSMREMDGMIDNGFYAWAFRAAANRLLQDAGVHLSWQTDVIGVQTTSAGRSIQCLKLLTPRGIQKVCARQFIDTSGDAQLVALGGFAWRKGDETHGALQALTLFFRMGNIDVRKAAAWASQNRDQFLPWMDFQFDFSRIISIAGYKGLIKEAKKMNLFPEDVDYVFFTTLPESGEASFNTTNILGVDASHSEGITRAESEGHRQLALITDFLISRVPGFENAWLMDSAPQVGVRETRRAEADYMINGKDILSGARFQDAVARGCYGIDIHGQKNENSRMDELGEGSWYEIPLRSLLVKDTENLMVAGRCIGATREGHAALRIMPTSAATGEACGALAALAVRRQQALREVPYAELRHTLIHNLEEYEQ